MTDLTKLTKEELMEELETERMKLVACSVSAVSNTRESAKKQRIERDNSYWSPSYQDVCNTVDREMALREKLEKCRVVLEDVKLDCPNTDCGNSGGIPRQVGEQEWTQEQCQFCWCIPTSVFLINRFIKQEFEQ